jgi:hypothetical protein
MKREGSVRLTSVYERVSKDGVPFAKRLSFLFIFKAEVSN